MIREISILTAKMIGSVCLRRRGAIIRSYLAYVIR
jgi:hypothetical protein